LTWDLTANQPEAGVNILKNLGHGPAFVTGAMMGGLGGPATTKSQTTTIVRLVYT